MASIPKTQLLSTHSPSLRCPRILFTPLVLLLLFWPVTLTWSHRHAWESPGCHRVAHTRIVSIPGCVPFEMILNACRGYCLSYAIPSPLVTLKVNPNHIITSRAECCGIVDTYDVRVIVSCRNGYQLKIFKAARSCSCSVCRREQ